ncbi:NERD domain-containing protein/DEAD/DEAH box helicase [Nocardioides sp. NPDC127503]|uniref:nuclease-related domain-containing DEAD/DEAH box helicase n=1 Tax=Nocardioides sp. NPDC127503 TaxID=3154516 RepID=UPI00332EEF7D
MARMIPAYCLPGAAPGEQALHKALAECDGTDDWIVLHSLAIAEHIKKPEGEADFVVIVPGRGILVIEVKSHLTIDYHEGIWKLGNDAPTARGPIKQAADAMHSIRKYLLRKQVDLGSIPILSAGWFTAVRARTMLPESPEWHDWQVLDSEDLRNGVGAAILRTMKAGTVHLSKTTYVAYGEVGPSEAETRRIALVLRPQFEAAVVAGDLRHARESDLVHFVEEQYEALDSMADNHAVLFTGPAGSGKTFLAMEAARREVVLRHRGRLICFNSLLGRRLRDDTPTGDALMVGTLHRQLLDIAGVTPPVAPSATFWTEELPERAMEAIVAAGDDEAVDFLVVDEVQDILREPYLDVLDLMVKGGLQSGRVLLFGDFERQAIFDDGAGRDLLRKRVPHLPTGRLIMNCRNRPRIGFSVNMFSGLRPGYQKFRRDDDGMNPAWLKYEAGRDQTPLLVEAIQRLRDEHYQLHEIAVLSPLADGSVAASTTDRWLRQVLRPATGQARRKGEVQYATIQAFKGLEAPAVIVTDLDRKVVPSFTSVMYVGLTRATDRLYGLIEADTLRAGMEGEL